MASFHDNLSKPVPECPTMLNFVQQEIMAVALVTTGTLRRAKLQSNQHQQHTQFLQAICPSYFPTNCIKALKARCVNSSLQFNSHFPGEPGLAIVYWSKGWRRRCWHLDYWSYRAKLQSNHHHQQTNIQFFTGRTPFLSPNQQCQRSEGKYHIPWTCLSQAHLGVFQLCLWPLIAPGYLGGALACLLSALWCQ